MKKTKYTGKGDYEGHFGLLVK